MTKTRTTPCSWAGRRAKNLSQQRELPERAEGGREGRRMGVEGRKEGGRGGRGEEETPQGRAVASGNYRAPRR